MADDETIPADEGWNHNTFHHPVVLAALPPGAERALDVGCGEGILSRELAGRVPHVVGLDAHRPTLAAAAAVPGSSVAYVEGDLCRHPFVPGSFDLVATIATLHHVDAEVGLRQLADLVRPGGALVVVGLARSRPHNWPTDAAGTVEVAHCASGATRRPTGRCRRRRCGRRRSPTPTCVRSLPVSCPAPPTGATGCSATRSPGPGRPRPRPPGRHRSCPPTTPCPTPPTPPTTPVRRVSTTPRSRPPGCSPRPSSTWNGPVATSTRRASSWAMPTSSSARRPTSSTRPDTATWRPTSAPRSSAATSSRVAGRSRSSRSSTWRTTTSSGPRSGGSRTP